MATGWGFLAEYASLVEAEFDKARLEGVGIPVLVKGPEAGIFGPGFSGPSAFGVKVYVPAAALDDARALLDPEAGEDPE